MDLGQVVSSRSAGSRGFIVPATICISLMIVMVAVLWPPWNPRTALAQCQPQFVYVGNGASIYAYQLDPTPGNLTSVTGSPFNERFDATAMALNPAGSFLFVTNGNGDNNVSVFSINQTTGALTEVRNSPFSTGLGINPQLAAVDPSGKFLSVGNQMGTQWPCSAEYDA